MRTNDCLAGLVFLVIINIVLFLVVVMVASRESDATPSDATPSAKASFADTETIIVEGKHGPYECIVSKSKQGMAQTCFKIEGFG